MKHESHCTEPSHDHDPKRKVVVYQFRPTTFLGRVLAFLILISMLVVVFVFSIVLFSILLTGIFCLFGYAFWRSHHMTNRQSRVIDVESKREL